MPDLHDPHAQPPRYAEFLLRTFLGSDRDEILGDMTERFENVWADDGPQQACHFYWKRTFGCIGPVLIHSLGRLVTGRRREYAYSGGMPLSANTEEAPVVPARWMDALHLAVYVAMLAGVGWMVWGVDGAYAITLSPFCLLVTWGLFGLISLSCLLAKKWRWVTSAMAVYAIALALLACVDQTAEKAMNRLETRIQPGMTRTEVERLAAQYFPARGRFGVARWYDPSRAPGDERPSSWRYFSTKAVVLSVEYSPKARVKSTVVSD